MIAGTRGPQRATMKLDVDGKSMIEECEGNGPVDAVFNCIKAMVPHDAVLELYQVHAVTEGTDAQAEVSVRLSEHGRSVTAKGADPDTLVASAKAYLAALNKLVARRLRGAICRRAPYPLDGCGVVAAAGLGLLAPAPRGRYIDPEIAAVRRLSFPAGAIRPGKWWKFLTRWIFRLGRIAQLVEQLTLNQRVQGSSPCAPTILLRAPRFAGFAST